jgi:mRNA interferase MazF
MVIVLPVTSRVRPIPAHVAVHPPEGGLRVESAILCDAVRSISKERLVRQWGLVAEATLSAVEDRLRLLLRL